MPIVSPHPFQPLVDGRQSDRAMLVRRGVQRLMLDRRIALLPEVSLASGRRADLLGLAGGGDLLIVEIKTSLQDFRVDRKWPEYRLHCDRLYFATHPGVPAEIFPEDCGLIVTDGYAAEMLREAPEHRLPPARRKAVTLAFGRLAADRLMQAEWSANPVALPRP
ncbi:MmcB family DNA repair protein [Aureimonas glaciei]|uniref:DNA repair protein MmcB-related protein n=1 Tax=Aureimonas glaciei TaxID=1776957 RepID=A0A916V2L9_9HYPH|nr:MmcB family DNA repair protein [Aureimonas glaciei]GGD02763.1 hypothetical protein GCM10011335_01820 [Aureimonas glaciei]